MTSISSTMRASLCIAALIAATGASQAGTVLVSATADTTISEHEQLGNGSVPLGNRDQLYVIGTPGFRSSALVRFDLSAYAGATVQGTVGWFTLSIYQFSDPFVSMDLRLVTTAWDEATATLNNLGEPFGALVNNATASLSNPNHVAGYRDFDFAVPVAIIQDWIDDPSSNFGLALVATGGRDIDFTSREFIPQSGPIGSWSPTLEFDLPATDVPGTVSEPPLLAYGLLLLLAPFLPRKRQNLS